MRCALEKGLSLRGVVNDGTGRPLAGARVKADVGGPDRADRCRRRLRPRGRTRRRRGTCAPRDPALARVGRRLRGAHDGPVHGRSPGPVPQPAPAIVLGVGNGSVASCSTTSGCACRTPSSRWWAPTANRCAPARRARSASSRCATSRPARGAIVALAAGWSHASPTVDDRRRRGSAVRHARRRAAHVGRAQVVDASNRPVAGARLEPGPDRRGERLRRPRERGRGCRRPRTPGADSESRCTRSRVPCGSLPGFDPQEIVLENDRRPDPIRLRWYLPNPKPKPR